MKRKEGRKERERSVFRRSPARPRFEDIAMHRAGRIICRGKLRQISSGHTLPSLYPRPLYYHHLCIPSWLKSQISFQPSFLPFFSCSSISPMILCVRTASTLLSTSRSRFREGEGEREKERGREREGERGRERYCNIFAYNCELNLMYVFEIIY